MKVTENAKRLSSQIVDFHSFVTEKFCLKELHISLFGKSQKLPFMTTLVAKLQALPKHLDKS